MRSISRVDAGETVAIVGPNGAGKSTLLRLLSGDLRAISGTVRLKQRDLHAYSSRQLAHASRDAVAACQRQLSLHGRRDRAHGRRRQRPRRSPSRWSRPRCTRSGSTSFRHRKLPTLSGGEQQRAHFARVLVQLACGEAAHGPGVLLLDEPTSSLDLRHQIDLVETARRRAANGTAVVAILHDLNLAVRFADRIVVLHRGAKVADDVPANTVTDELIRTVFEIDVRVQRHSDGTPLVLPQLMTAIEPRLQGTS